MQELQVRWMQWGCFTPLMRNHCSSPMVDELYRMGQTGRLGLRVQKKFITLRYRLLPYTLQQCGRRGTQQRQHDAPLVMDFAKDKKAINLSDEYLFGRNILVKPVTQPLYTWKDDSKQGHLTYPDIAKSEAAVKVYLPEGTDWFDFWTNERPRVARETMRACPITLMPSMYVPVVSSPSGPLYGMLLRSNGTISKYVLILEPTALSPFRG